MAEILRQFQYVFEQVIAEVWARVLELEEEEVGLDDHFFASGGSSMQAMQMTSRLCETFGVSIPVDTLFEEPTVRGVARQVQRELGEGDQSADRPHKATEEESGRVSYAQEQIWLSEQRTPGTAAFHIPWAFDLYGEVEVDALAKAMDTLVRRHEALRASFEDETGMVTMKVADEAWVELAEYDLTRIPESLRHASAEDRLLELARRPFNLRRAPLLRADLIKLDSEEHVLLLTLHHLISDDHSAAVLVSELADAYKSISRGEVPQVETASSAFRELAASQRRYVRGPEAAADLRYWQGVLDDAPVAAEPPSVRDGKTWEFSVSPEVTTDLRRSAGRLRTTLFVLLLTAFHALLRQQSKTDDIVVGITSANRTAEKEVAVVGPVFNLLAIRSDLPEDPPFARFAAHVQERVLSGLAHQRVPFDVVTDGLIRGRKIDGPGLFEVLFEMFPGTAPIQQGDLAWSSPRLIDTGMAKYSLAIAFTEQDDHLTGRFTFASTAVEQQAENLHHDLFILLEAVRRDPEIRLSELGRGLKRDWAPSGFADKGPSEKSSVQKLLLEVCAELLELAPEEISADDSFFALGGRSLDLVRLRSWILSEMRFKVDTKQLFRRPRMEAIAMAVVAAEPRHGLAEDLASAILGLWKSEPDTKDSMLRQLREAQ